MKATTAWQIVGRHSKVRLSPAALRTACQRSVKEFSAAESNGYGGYNSLDSSLVEEALGDLKSIDPALFETLHQQFSAARQKRIEDEAVDKAKQAAEKAAQEARAAVRVRQIVAAIVQASKQGLNPLALAHCGVPAEQLPAPCPEPVVTLWMSHKPESEILNTDHIESAFCAQHWRAREAGADSFAIHWHDLSFMHPKISTVVIDRRVVYRAWTRNPEQFGKPVQVAKDMIGAPITRGSLVTYTQSVGNPKVSQATEQAFGRVERIFQVGTVAKGVRVIQVRRILIKHEPKRMSLSPRLSTKYADRVLALSAVPKKFENVFDMDPGEWVTPTGKRIDAIPRHHRTKGLDVPAAAPAAAPEVIPTPWEEVPF